MSTGNESPDTVVEKTSIINQRKGHRAYVTRIINNVKSILEDYSEKDRNRLLSYKTSLGEKLFVLNGLNGEVLNSMPNDEHAVEEEIVRSSEITDEINEMMFAIDSKLNINELSNSPSFLAPSTHHVNETKLPKLSLPLFSGNVVEYQGFWDSFNAAVHENPKLENITKFNYLKSVLKGQALSAVSGLALTSSNYNEAVEILKRRYGNKQLLISTHMEKILSIPSVTSINDLAKIREVYDEIEGPVLISIVMSKLPYQIELVIESYASK